MADTDEQRQLARLNARIERLLPLWATQDTPARAADDLARATDDLARASGRPRWVIFDGGQRGAGTDELEALLAAIRATERAALMGGRAPAEELAVLLRRKLGLLGLLQQLLVNTNDDY